MARAPRRSPSSSSALCSTRAVTRHRGPPGGECRTAFGPAGFNTTCLRAGPGRPAGVASAGRTEVAQLGHIPAAGYDVDPGLGQAPRPGRAPTANRGELQPVGTGVDAGQVEQLADQPPRSRSVWARAVCRRGPGRPRPHRPQCSLQHRRGRGGDTASASSCETFAISFPAVLVGRGQIGRHLVERLAQLTHPRPRDDRPYRLRVVTAGHRPGRRRSSPAAGRVQWPLASSWVARSARPRSRWGPRCPAGIRPIMYQKVAEPDPTGDTDEQGQAST